MPADLADRWRDEDGTPSPSEELVEWWLESDANISTPEIGVTQTVAPL